MEIWAIFPAKEDAIAPCWICKLERAIDNQLYWRGYTAPQRESANFFFKDAAAKGAISIQREIRWRGPIFFKTNGTVTACSLWEPYLEGDLTAPLVEVSEENAKTY